MAWGPGQEVEARPRVLGVAVDADRFPRCCGGGRAIPPPSPARPTAVRRVGRPQRIRDGSKQVGQVLHIAIGFRVAARIDRDPPAIRLLFPVKVRVLVVGLVHGCLRYGGRWKRQGGGLASRRFVSVDPPAATSFLRVSPRGSPGRRPCGSGQGSPRHRSGRGLPSPGRCFDHRSPRQDETGRGI